MLDRTESLSGVIADFASRLRPDDLPEAVNIAARRAALDVLGVMAAASRAEMAARLQRNGLMRSNGVAGATAFGAQGSMSPDGAALWNGVLAHALDFDDTFQPGIVHVGAVVIPASIAMAESVHQTDSELIAAIVLGYELTTRLGAACPGGFHQRGYHATPICGAFGAALSAGSLLGFDAGRMANSLGIVGSMAAGLQEFLSDGSDTKRLHAGWAAMAGINAAYFADVGFSGPRRIFEGAFGLYATHVESSAFSPEVIARGWGTEWNIMNTSVKPYPCCHLMHAHIDAARQIRQGTPFRLDDVARIRATIHEPGMHIVVQPEGERWRPATSYSAQFSLPFGVAAALTDDFVTLGSFDTSRLEDHQFRRLIDVTECVLDQHTKHPQYFDGTVEVWLKDSSYFSHREDINRGSADRPLTDDELVMKFTANLEAAGLATSSDPNRLAEMVLEDGRILEAVRLLGSALRLGL